jgi:hypothetical protein
MLYLLVTMGMLVAEQQFSAASLMGRSEACMIGDDISRILAAAMNSTPSVNVQISEWPRSCRMFSALGCIFVYGPSFAGKCSAYTARGGL